MPFDPNADNMGQIPAELIGVIAQQMDRSTFHDFQSASRLVRDQTTNEFAARYYRDLDVAIIGNHLRPIESSLDNSAYAGSVRTIIFTDLAGQFGNMLSQITLVKQILAKTPRLNSIRFQTGLPRNSQVVYQCLTDMVAQPDGSLTVAIPGLRTLDITPDEHHRRPARLASQDILDILTRYQTSLQNFSIDSAILTAADWEPILVYIRDQLNLENFRFAHHDFYALAPEPLFAVEKDDAVHESYYLGETLDIEESTAEMRGAEAVKRGANRLLQILELDSFDPRMMS
ncbi:hypothetical protein Slin14017_G093490 [Septoria linicola]|nr:hypothetical protein Slin14017_G093490 [Septoria linicola]